MKNTKKKRSCYSLGAKFKTWGGGGGGGGGGGNFPP